jgi:hypothetical protein
MELKQPRACGAVLFLGGCPIGNHRCDRAFPASGIRKVNAMTLKHHGKQSDRFRNNGGSDVTEHDLADGTMGDNALQGDDQGNVHNQRHAQPQSKTETDSLAESLEKTDKNIRAQRDLRKGNRA